VSSQLSVPRKEHQWEWVGFRIGVDFCDKRKSSFPFLQSNPGSNLHCCHCTNWAIMQ